MASFEFESNDTLSSANTGIFGTSIGGQLNSITDKDFFKFTLSESAALNLKFKLPAGSTNDSFKIEVMDGSGIVIFSNSGGADFSNIVFSPFPGTYYIAVSASDLTKFSSDQYGITLSTLPSVTATGELETNNSAITATLIPVGNGTPLVDALETPTVLGNLSGVSDKDYFKFSVDQTGIYSFKFDAPTNLTPDEVVSGTDPDGTIKEFFKISILDSSENVLVSHYVSGTPTSGYLFDFAANFTGDYYLLIENGGSTTIINTTQYNFEINPAEPSIDNATIVNGGLLKDYLLGTSTNDIINGNDGNDILVGMNGNDSLDGGVGVDTMKGGTGNDIYVVNSASDLIIENGGDGTDRVISTVSYTLAKNVENIKLADGSTAKIATGNTQANILIGNEFGNILNGLDGNDTLDGGVGINGDILAGGNGNDTYYINNKLDKVSEGSSIGSGVDTVIGRVNITSLYANVENIQLANVESVIYATGNTLANEIVGNNLDNQLAGLAGNDALYGRGGNDALTGGAGNDYLEGNAGSDYFVFDTTLSSTTNADTIGDFESGVDTIQLSKTIFTKLVGAVGNDYVGELSAANFHEGVAAADTDDFIIYDQATGNLYYDADGVTAVKAAILFANLGAGTDLASTDFTVL
ncbi:MAG: calcium-binding protein [Candidatus Methylopumilus sp.]|jgi:Ca2+-binding RTX toxin-like protein